MRAELEALLDYANAVTQGFQSFPTRSDIVDGGHGYVGGALTTLRRLNLLTSSEYDEWTIRLDAALPPKPEVVDPD